MTFAYATTNVASALAASAFTPTSGPSDATRSYLNDGRMDKQYAFTAGTSATIAVDFGSAVALSGWGILNHNLASIDLAADCSVTVQSADNSGFSVNLATNKQATQPNLTAPRSKDMVLQFAVSTSRRYWRIQFSWLTSAVFKIGELFPYGSTAVPTLTRGQIDGSGEVERYLTAEAELQTGETRSTFFGGPVREKRLRSQDLATTEADELRTLWRATRGPVTPFLWIESYEAVATAAAVAEQDCIFGRLMLPEFAWSWSDYARQQPPELVIRSLGREVGS